MSELKFPTERIDLPSKGLPYPVDSPLAKGFVEMKYMTAKEEDILTNTNFIKQGIVIDKLIQSMVVTPINYDDLLVGDKNALLIASRILGYGKEYEFSLGDEKINFDLTTLDPKPIDESIFIPGKNDFDFTLPMSKVVVSFKLLNNHDEKNIDKEILGMKKLSPQGSFDVTTRLKHTITAINGNREQSTIRGFVDNMLAKDVRSLQSHINQIAPDINMKISVTRANGDVVEGVNLPIGVNFFWPDAGI
jgi:hypothetical protein